jgi:hypothetical protein
MYRLMRCQANAKKPTVMRLLRFGKPELPLVITGAHAPVPVFAFLGFNDAPQQRFSPPSLPSST